MGCGPGRILHDLVTIFMENAMAIPNRFAKPGGSLIDMNCSRFNRIFDAAPFSLEKKKRTHEDNFDPIDNGGVGLRFLWLPVRSQARR